MLRGDCNHQTKISSVPFLSLICYHPIGLCAMASRQPAPKFLLVLPALSLPTSRASLKAAYKPTFESLLKQLRDKTGQSGFQLDVGVALSSSYYISPNVSRGQLFLQIQKLYRDIFTLACVVAAQLHVELDLPGGADIRVFMLEARIDSLPDDVVGKQSLSGPIIDLHTFVKAGRRYESIYAVEGENAEGVLSSLLQLWREEQRTAPRVQRLPRGPAMTQSRPSTSQGEVDGPLNRSIHKSVAVGGTFDHLHIGHKLLLSATVLLAEPDSSSPPASTRLITVGITGDELLVNKKHASFVESWEERQSRTAAFVESILVFHPDIPSIRKIESMENPGPNGKLVKISYGDELVIDYVRISDPFGPTITNESISALVISKETRSGGKAVNDRRKEKGWQELEVFEVDVLDQGMADNESEEHEDKETFEGKISSTEIRRKMRERSGHANGA